MVTCFSNKRTKTLRWRWIQQWWWRWWPDTLLGRMTTWSAAGDVVVQVVDRPSEVRQYAGSMVQRSTRLARRRYLGMTRGRWRPGMTGALRWARLRRRSCHRRDTARPSTGTSRCQSRRPTEPEVRPPILPPLPPGWSRDNCRLPVGVMTSLRIEAAAAADCRWSTRHSCPSQSRRRCWRLHQFEDSSKHDRCRLLGPSCAPAPQWGHNVRNSTNDDCDSLPALNVNFFTTLILAHTSCCVMHLTRLVTKYLGSSSEHALSVGSRLICSISSVATNSRAISHVTGCRYGIDRCVVALIGRHPQ